LKEAAEILDRREDVRILAGGTDLLILLRNGMLGCRYMLDVKKIPELHVLERNGDRLEIGGAVNLNRLLESPLVDNAFCALRDGAATLANSLLRNRATLVGNICNASPGGDMLPPALVLDGTVHAASVSGIREIPLAEFFTGVKKHVLKKNELVTKIAFPVKKGKSVYLKKTRIKGHDLAQVGVSAFWAEDGTLSVALGAVAPTPVLVAGLGPYDRKSLEKAREEIEEAVRKRISPISDTRGSKEYRTAMARYFIGEIISRWKEAA